MCSRCRLPPGLRPPHPLCARGSLTGFQGLFLTCSQMKSLWCHLRSARYSHMYLLRFPLRVKSSPSDFWALILRTPELPLPPPLPPPPASFLRVTGVLLPLAARPAPSSSCSAWRCHEAWCHWRCRLWVFLLLCANCSLYFFFFFFKELGRLKKKYNCFLLAQVRIPLKNFKCMLRSEFWLRSGLLRTMYGTQGRPETERPDRVQYFRK